MTAYDNNYLCEPKMNVHFSRDRLLKSHFPLSMMSGWSKPTARLDLGWPQNRQSERAEEPSEARRPRRTLTALLIKGFVVTVYHVAADYPYERRGLKGTRGFHCSLWPGYL